MPQNKATSILNIGHIIGILQMLVANKYHGSCIGKPLSYIHFHCNVMRQYRLQEAVNLINSGKHLIPTSGID